MSLTDEQLPRLCDDLGIPGFADVHVHFLPDRMLTKVWDYFDSAAGLLGKPWPIHYRQSEPERLAIVRQLGLRGIPSLTYPHKPTMARWLNHWCAEFAARVPDAVHSATLYPEPDTGDYVAEAIAAGARIFKVHVQVGAYAPDDPLLDTAWEQLAATGLPVVIHCGSGPQPGEFTGSRRIANVLARFPELTLVIAHAGLPEYHEFADLVEMYPRVHLDTTMVATDFTEATWPMPQGYVARLGDLGDRVVLGSDFPNIPYPYAHQIEALRRLALGDDWLRTVLWRNGARLLGLS